jgi:hypothetical protein
LTYGRTMNRINKFSAGAVLLTVAIVLPSKTFAQSVHDAIGMWVFVSSINEQNGRKTETYGPGASGLMVLDSTGRYSITIIAAALPKFVSNNRTTATADEAKAVVARSNAHFGIYSINPGDETITFKIESATFPNWNGTEQKRTLIIKGDELQYAVTASSAGGSSVVTWKRAK